jgi:hypothetical protein
MLGRAKAIQSGVWPELLVNFEFNMSSLQPCPGKRESLNNAKAIWNERKNAVKAGGKPESLLRFPSLTPSGFAFVPVKARKSLKATRMVLRCIVSREQEKR